MNETEFVEFEKSLQKTLQEERRMKKEWMWYPLLGIIVMLIIILGCCL